MFWSSGARGQLRWAPLTRPVTLAIRNSTKRQTGMKRAFNGAVAEEGGPLDNWHFALESGQEKSSFH
ncbi:unnamed protein product [Calypogeia fissa]